MYIKLLIVFSLLFSTAGFAQRYRPITLSDQASLAFDTHRWKSASTLYELLLKDSIHYTPLMAKSLMANILAGDSASIVQAKNLYERNITRVDSLLIDFRKLCVITKRFDLYTTTLSQLQEEYPDHARRLQMEKIRYRFFLRQPDDAIVLIDEMLAQESRSIDLLELKAEAYQLKGDSNRALSMYRLILTIDPDNLLGNLYLGNYYYVFGNTALQKLNDEYKKLTETHRFKVSDYRRQANAIWKTYLVHAYYYLDKASIIMNSAEVSQSLHELQDFKNKLDFANGYS